MSVPASATRTLLHPDRILQEVLASWTARFLSGQIQLADSTATMSRIDGWEHWGAEWAKTAAVRQEPAEWAEERRVSAGASFLTVASCHHVAFFSPSTTRSFNVAGWTR